MREKLKEQAYRRGTFTATFSRFGKRTAYKGSPLITALFLDVCDASGTQVTEHLWFTVGKQMAALDMKPGDRVSMVCRVLPYVKGYRGRREDDDLPAPSQDYRLSRPTNVRKIVPFDWTILDDDEPAPMRALPLPLFDGLE